MDKDLFGDVLRESAIVIAGCTALLFVWGYAFEAFRWTGSSVPGLFQPEVAVQERALVGGIVGLFVFVPAALVAWALDMATKSHLRNWLGRTWTTGSVHRVVLVALTFALSVAAIRPIANVSDRYGRRLKVESVVLKNGAPSPVQKGMYCIGRRAGAYVFVDTLSGDPRTIYLVSEDEIRSLSLVYGH